MQEHPLILILMLVVTACLGIAAGAGFLLLTGSTWLFGWCYAVSIICSYALIRCLYENRRA